MTIPIILTLVASFIWATTNHIDKFMLCNVKTNTSNVKTLLLFSSLIAGIVLSPIWLIFNRFQVDITIFSLIFTLLAAPLYVLATYFYFKALEKNDTSVVVAMFQLLPVFSYILSLIFFKEILNINEIIGALIIITSAITISFEFDKNKGKNKFIALVFMTLSSLFYALYFFSFDVAIRNSDYNSVAFWYQIGLLITGLIFMCFKSYRESFKNILKGEGKKFISLNITNEILNLIANLMVNFANLSIPLALANSLNGFQRAFAFIIGAIGVVLVPKIITEDLNKKIVIQKIASIILGIVGLIIIVS